MTAVCGLNVFLFFAGNPPKARGSSSGKRVQLTVLQRTVIRGCFSPLSLTMLSSITSRNKANGQHRARSRAVGPR